MSYNGNKQSDDVDKDAKNDQTGDYPGENRHGFGRIRPTRTGLFQLRSVVVAEIEFALKCEMASCR